MNTIQNIFMKFWKGGGGEASSAPHKYAPIDAHVHYPNLLARHTQIILLYIYIYGICSDVISGPDPTIFFAKSLI